MTRRANARIAGLAFLVYIAVGIPALVLMGRATQGEGVAAQLASIAQHTTDVRLAVVLDVFGSFMALVLGVTLYALTRDQDPDLAMLGLTFRVGEGVMGGMGATRTLGLVWLATATGADAPSRDATQALGAYLLRGQGGGATFFAVGSLLFSWLLLRGRMIPAPLAWLGVVASLLWIVAFPLQTLQVFPGFATTIMYILMAAFEVTLALWLLIKGTAAPVRIQAA
jgi:uncharacterized protein DUF4386